MLDPQDRAAIEGLFARIAEVARRAPGRDPDAEDLIAREIQRQPNAPYYMAQTIVMQQRALELADQRIRDLEDQLNQRGRGGLFGGMFGDGDRPQPAQRPPGPWDRGIDRAPQNQGRSAAGGGFLAGAAQTALGVAGGVLLGSAIGSLLGAAGAHAAEGNAGRAPGDDQSSDQADQQDAHSDETGDFGDDGGGFDIGGDF